MRLESSIKLVEKSVLNFSKIEPQHRGHHAVILAAIKAAKEKDISDLNLLFGDERKSEFYQKSTKMPQFLIKKIKKIYLSRVNEIRMKILNGVCIGLEAGFYASNFQIEQVEEARKKLRKWALNE